MVMVARTWFSAVIWKWVIMVILGCGVVGFPRIDVNFSYTDGNVRWD
jgi:hypothetical protein